MPGKTKKHFEVVIQRGKRGKMGIPLGRYDDSGYNKVIKKRFRWKPMKGRVNLDALEKENKQ